MPQGRGIKGREFRVGWMEEHPHRSRVMEHGMGISRREETGKGIIFEM